jgi:hypothetical protein
LWHKGGKLQAPALLQIHNIKNQCFGFEMIYSRTGSYFQGHSGTGS